MHQQITIAGTAYPISFGMAALYAYERQHGHSLLSKFQDLQNGDISMSLIVHIAQVGLQQGHRKAGLPFSMTAEDVADLLDQDPTALEQVMSALSASFPAQEQAAVGQKKS